MNAKISSTHLNICDHDRTLKVRSQSILHQALWESRIFRFDGGASMLECVGCGSDTSEHCWWELDENLLGGRSSLVTKFGGNSAHTSEPGSNTMSSIPSYGNFGDGYPPL